MISQWEHHIPALTSDEGIEYYSTRIEWFYFNDNFHCVAQWVLGFRNKCQILIVILLTAADCEHFLLQYLAYLVLALVVTGLQYPFRRNTYHVMRYTILYGSL